MRPDSKQAVTPSDGPLDIVIFGGAGDLAFRKLIPALFSAHQHDKLDADTRIIGVGRQDWGREGYLAFINEKAKPFIEKALTESSNPDGLCNSFLSRLDFANVDVTNAAAYSNLAAISQAGAQRVFYLATAPSLFTQICANLTAVNLVDDRTRVVLEKPLGHDLASAQAINNEVAQYFTESRSTGSIITSAKRRCKTSWCCALETPFWSLCGVAPIFAAYKSLWPRRWVWAAARASTTKPAPCATWCKTTCCNCCASWPWNRRYRWIRTTFVTRN